MQSSLVQSSTAVLSRDSEAEILGQHIEEFLHPNEQKKQLQVYQQRLESRPAREEYETMSILKDGRILHVRIKVQGISWDHRPADLVTIEDVSDLKCL